jgi:hypothetical protein
MKQRHIQSFLVVSAAFFAMNAAPIRPNSSLSSAAATPVQQAAQTRTSVADARSRRESGAVGSTDESAV